MHTVFSICAIALGFTVYMYNCNYSLHVMGMFLFSQVLKLLEVMNLQQYVDTFRQQHINGDILSDCDEDILQNELEVKSRLHRLRLQRVITGQYCVADMMSDQDYVIMQPLCC